MHIDSRWGLSAFCRGKCCAAKYQNILEIGLLPSISTLKLQNTYTFQQDGVSCHTPVATRSKALLKSKQFFRMERPPSGPDLSPLKTLWWKMKTSIKIKKWFKREYYWDSRILEMCKELVAILPHMIKDVIASIGNTTTL